MGEIIEMILSNPLLFILIVGGLISLFNRKKGEEYPERTKPTPKPRPTLTRAERPAIPTETREEYRQRRQRQPQVDPLPVEVHYESQLDDLKNQLGVEEKRERQSQVQTRQAAKQLQERLPLTYRSQDRREKRLNNSKLAFDKHRFQKQFKDNVSASKLINSVIMAEVLGPPRALKPYERSRYRYRKK